MTLTLLIDFWKTGNDRHDCHACREGYPNKGFSTGRGSKKGQKQEILLRTAQNRPKTGKRESHTELFCDKNPKTFQVFAGAESS